MNSWKIIKTGISNQCIRDRHLIYGYSEEETLTIRVMGGVEGGERE